MNRYLVSSAVIGASIGVLHGRLYRKTTHSWYEHAIYDVRNGVTGAALYPFVIPIATYQLYADAKSKSAPSNCIFSAITKSKPKALVETNSVQ